MSSARRCLPCQRPAARLVPPAAPAPARRPRPPTPQALLFCCCRRPPAAPAPARRPRLAALQAPQPPAAIHGELPAGRDTSPSDPHAATASVGRGRHLLVFQRAAAGGQACSGHAAGRVCHTQHGQPHLTVAAKTQHAQRRRAPQPRSAQLIITICTRMHPSPAHPCRLLHAAQPPRCRPGRVR